MQLGRLNVRSSRRSANKQETAVSTNKSKREPGYHFIAALNVVPTRTNRWFSQRYNVNNAWIFNGNNGKLNNNNVNNTNRCQAVAILLDYPQIKKNT